MTPFRPASLLAALALLAACDSAPAGADLTVAPLAEIEAPLGVAQPSSLAFTPDGSTLLSGHAAGAIYAWDAGTGRSAGAVSERAHRYNVYAMAFSADGAYLLTGGSADELVLWDGRSLDSLGVLEPAEGPPGSVSTIAAGPGARAFVVGWTSGPMGVYDAENRRLTTRFRAEDEGAVYPADLAARPGTGHVASSGGAFEGRFVEAVTLWDAGRGRPVRTVGRGTPFVTALDFDTGGRRLAFVAPDSTVTVANADSGAPLARWRASVPLLYVAFGEGDRHLVTVGYSEQGEGTRGRYVIEVWDPSGVRLAGPVGEEAEFLSPFALSGDGRTLAVAEGRRIALWAVSDGE